MRTFIKHCDACFEDKTKRLFYNILSFNLNKGVKSALFTFSSVSIRHIAP